MKDCNGCDFHQRVQTDIEQVLRHLRVMETSITGSLQGQILHEEFIPFYYENDVTIDTALRYVVNKLQRNHHDRVEYCISSAIPQLNKDHLSILIFILLRQLCLGAMFSIKVELIKIQIHLFIDHTTIDITYHHVENNPALSVIKNRFDEIDREINQHDLVMQHAFIEQDLHICLIIPQ